MGRRSPKLSEIFLAFLMSFHSGASSDVFLARKISKPYKKVSHIFWTNVQCTNQFGKILTNATLKEKSSHFLSYDDLLYKFRAVTGTRNN